MPSSPEARLQELGLELPEPLPVAGKYQLAKRHGDLLFVAGHVSAKPDRTGVITGKLGADLTVEEGAEAARACGLYMLSTLRAELGTLDRVTSILKLFGMINATPDFGHHAPVMDGCAGLLIDVFGEDAGLATRAAVGMGSLPIGVAVETEMMVA